MFYVLGETVWNLITRPEHPIWVESPSLASPCRHGEAAVATLVSSPDNCFSWVNTKIVNYTSTPCLPPHYERTKPTPAITLYRFHFLGQFIDVLNNQLEFVFSWFFNWSKIGQLKSGVFLTTETCWSRIIRNRVWPHQCTAQKPCLSHNFRKTAFGWPPHSSRLRKSCASLSLDFWGHFRPSKWLLKPSPVMKSIISCITQCLSCKIFWSPRYPVRCAIMAHGPIRENVEKGKQESYTLSA